MANEKTTIHLRHPTFKSPEGRLSFARDLFTARAQEEGKAPKFGCTIIFPKSAKAELGRHLEKLLLETPGWGAAAVERFKKKLIKSPILEDTGPGTKSPLRSNKNDELHPGMEEPGAFILRPTAGTDHAPAVWFRDPNRHETEAVVFSGCYGKAVINFFSYTHPKSGDGIGVGISGFQKLKDGERLGGGGGVDAEKWHETIADEGPVPETAKSGAGASGLFGD